MPAVTGGADDPLADLGRFRTGFSATTSVIFGKIIAAVIIIIFVFAVIKSGGADISMLPLVLVALALLYGAVWLNQWLNLEAKEHEGVADAIGVYTGVEAAKYVL